MKDIFDQDVITLREEDHVYQLHTAPHLRFTSATTFIHQFFSDFNAKEVAENLVANNAKYAGKSAKQLVKSWKKFGDTGTFVHKELEDWLIAFREMKTLPEVTNQKSKHGVYWLEENLEDYYIPYPEMRVYSVKYQIAGTIDILLYNPKTDEWLILDWKTNKALYDRGFKGKKGTHAATAKLEDCNLVHYSLQLSLYQYLLEVEYGIRIKARVLLHLRPNATPYYPLGVKEYWTDYLKYDIERMLKHRLQQKEDGALFDLELNDN